MVEKVLAGRTLIAHLDPPCGIDLKDNSLIYWHDTSAPDHALTYHVLTLCHRLEYVNEWTDLLVYEQFAK